MQTTPDMGWAGKRNGELLRLAEREFDVFLTVDQRLQHQQNLSAFNIAVIVLVARSNAFEHLRPLMPTVRETLASAKPGEALVVSLANRVQLLCKNGRQAAPVRIWSVAATPRRRDHEGAQPPG